MKTVLILGASSDIGRACAQLFAKKGYDIILSGRNHERFEPLAKDLAIRHNVKCETVEFDTKDFDAHSKMIDHFGENVPEIVICLVGFMGEQDDAMKDWSITEKTINANFSGPVSILNQFANYYKQKGEGTIIGVSSVAGERGRQSNFVYGSSKAGFTAYLSGLRNSLFPHGVNVITIKPGFMYTKMTEHLDLPKLLTALPEAVAKRIHKAYKKKSSVVYIKSMWYWIMLIIRNIPEFIFKRLKL